MTIKSLDSILIEHPLFQGLSSNYLELLSGCVCFPSLEPKSLNKGNWRNCIDGSGAAT
jgi:hypothetical protein